MKIRSALKSLVNKINQLRSNIGAWIERQHPLIEMSISTCLGLLAIVIVVAIPKIIFYGFLGVAAIIVCLITGMIIRWILFDS